MESIGLKRDGTEFDVKMVIQRVAGPQEMTYIIAIRDISVRKQAKNALRRQNQQMEILSQVRWALSSTLDLNRVLEIILKDVCHLLKTTAASVWLVFPDTGELVCQQAFGLHSDLVRDWRLAPGQGIAGYVSSTGQSVIVPT